MLDDHRKSQSGELRPTAPGHSTLWRLAGSVPLGEWLVLLAAAPEHALDHAERQADSLGNALLGPLDAPSAENALMVSKRFGARQNANGEHAQAQKRSHKVTPLVP